MSSIKDIAIIFSGIILETLPFLLLGSLIAALIEVFISSDRLIKIIPKNKILATISGLLLGFIIPVCDCAVIPVARKLLKKGAGLNVVITYMLASPITNPIVLFSTFYALNGVNMDLFWYRLIGGIWIAMFVGIILSLFFNNKDVLLENNEENEHCHHHNCHHHLENTKKINNFFSMVVDILEHTIKDFLSVFIYLIIGTMLASVVQVALPQNIWDFFGQNNIISILILMTFAYLISLCSTSDSFLGKSLLANFSEQSVLAFLILGPMIDIKNTIVLFGNYKKKFVLSLIGIIFFFVFVYVVGVL